MEDRRMISGIVQVLKSGGLVAGIAIVKIRDHYLHGFRRGRRRGFGDVFEVLAH